MASKGKKVKVDRDALESLVEEANNVLGLEPEMKIGRKMSDEDLIEMIKANLDEVRESDFTEDAENGPFTDEARATIEALEIAIENDLEEEPVKEEPKKKGKKAAEKEEVKEEPKKKSKKEVEPEPEEGEVTFESVSEMDYKQLVALVEEKELDVDVNDFPKKKVEELREAIIEELELEEEEKPKAKGKAKKEEVEEEKPAKKGAKPNKKVEQEEEEKPKKGAKATPAKEEKEKAKPKAKKERTKVYGRMDSILDSIKTNRCHTFEQHKEWSGKKYCKERDCKYVEDYSNEWLRVALTALEAEGCCTLNKKGQYDFKG